MKIACAYALAELAREPVPDEVVKAFPAGKDFTFGREYLVPTPFDPRLLKAVSMAAAKAAPQKNNKQQNQKKRKTPNPDFVHNIEIGGSVVLGNPNAAVTITKFTDFQ